MIVQKTENNTIITLELSHDFILPTFLQEENSIIESLLLQTQELWELQRNMKVKGDKDSLKLMCDKIRLEAQKELAVEKECWLKEKAGLEREKTQLASQLDLKNQQLAGKLQAALGEISQLQESRIQLENQIRSSFAGELDILKECHTRELNNLKGIMSEYRLERDNSKKQLEDYLMTRNKSSSGLGQKGETDFLQMCKSVGIEAVHTGKQAQKGDYIATLDCGSRVLCEIKNYSGVVGSEEVRKFKRDMDVNKDCVAGLFCSLNTGISNIREAFYIDWLHDGRMLVFISEMNNYDGCYLLEIVKRLIGVIGHYKACDDESDGEGDILRERIGDAVKHIEILLKTSKSIMTNISHYKKHIDDMFLTLEKDMKRLREDIADILSGLTGKRIIAAAEATEVTSSSVAAEAAGGVEKKRKQRKPKASHV